MINKYPLQVGMSLNEIIAVKRTDIVEAAIIMIEELSLRYIDDPIYELDVKLAKKIITFISMLRHSGGDLGGVEFRLLPFQIEFVVISLAVVDRVSRNRKHTESILFIPRKNGKTELGAAINLWMLFGDVEKQKEIFVIASETNQAAILYGAVVSMLKQNKTLMKKVDIWRSTKTVENSKGAFLDMFKVLTSNADTKDGLRPNCIFADEPHAYPDGSLYNVLSEGMAHRASGFAMMLSTAGYNKQGFFHKKLQYAEDAMSGAINDPSMYLMSFAVTDDDNWEDEESWIKTNPALGFGVKMSYLRSKFTKALHSATDEVSFKTKHLNMWTDSAIAWIKDRDWKASYTAPVNEEDFVGKECYGGLDLSSTTDLTAFVLVFPNRAEGTYDVLCRFFMPKDNAAVRAKEDKVLYLDWIREGYITATEGNVVDYDIIEDQVRADCEKFDVREVAFDRWNSHGLVNNLTNDQVTEMVGFGQGYKSMSSPVKNIEALVLKKKLNHGNHPVLNWNVGNVLIIKDAADNVKIDKSKAREKVDGAVALAMAIGRADVYKDETVDVASLVG